MAPQEPVSGISGPSATRSQIQQSRALSRAAFQELQQTASEKLAIDYTEQAQFNPLAQLKNAETLERRFRRHDAKTSEHIKKDDDDEIIQVDATAKVAEDVQNRNPEFQKRNLLGLKKAILAEDTPEQILEKVLLSYPDHYLADEALDFLISTSDPKTKIGTNIRLAREILNERFGREVRAGRNTNHDAREFSKQGLGSPGAC